MPPTGWNIRYAPGPFLVRHSLILRIRDLGGMGRDPKQQIWVISPQIQDFGPRGPEIQVLRPSGYPKYPLLGGVLGTHPWLPRIHHLAPRACRKADP